MPVTLSVSASCLFVTVNVSTQAYLGSGSDLFAGMTGLHLANSLIPSYLYKIILVSQELCLFCL